MFLGRGHSRAIQMSCIGSPLVTRRIEIVSAAQHPKKPESITRIFRRCCASLRQSRMLSAPKPKPQTAPDTRSSSCKTSRRTSCDDHIPPKHLLLRRLPLWRLLLLLLLLVLRCRRGVLAGHLHHLRLLRVLVHHHLRRHALSTHLPLHAHRFRNSHDQIEVALVPFSCTWHTHNSHAAPCRNPYPRAVTMTSVHFCAALQRQWR